MIREYNDNDFNIVNIIGRDLSTNYKFQMSPVSRCFVYEINNEVVGFIHLDIFSDRAEIIDIAVLMANQNNGIGDKLLKYGINLCKENKCNNITLEVRVDNKIAIKLYKNNGFKTISIRKRYYQKGSIDAYLMSKEL